MTAATASHTPPDLVEGARLTVDGVELRVRVSGRRKRFALTVEPDAEVVLHVPAGRPFMDAERFVREHRTWLASKIALRVETMPLSPAKRLVEGEVFRYLGRTYRLAIDRNAPAGSAVRLVAGRLVITTEQAQNPAVGRAALIDWYCRAGQAWARGRLQPWAARLWVAEPAVGVSDLGGRWGTYNRGRKGDSASGLMSLGWPLFQLPMHLVDYVIAHELAHVRINGHGADYWRILRSALPECDERRGELNELGRRMWMGGIA
ncbi:M48 family metallopeptidase [Streptomyces montanisoli]|uniref:M48 family metallopeptidase n=1 Tax=Streptomyces montanisoli TaxID=2798581 RepID=A0A940M5G0_9ACTN|nr:SprT family zinc-dependent metalloprotease [Streptomyces montanisoli]MBP0456465.1 M48 family metallopeptidase [Streptomyces montanisoli]